ncbi:MAG TPA: ATP-binding protein [Usitatibacter sp.]|nr:ATP-binding protein [Usitatibacter sp.]
MGVIGGLSPKTWGKTETRTRCFLRACPANFLDWFAAVSFITVTLGAIVTAGTLSHFLARELLQWDAVMTAEYIVTIADTESTFKRFARRTGVVEVLGRAATASELGVSKAAADESIEELLDHIRTLPGAAAIMVYARDRSVVWAHHRENARPAGTYDAPAGDLLATAFALPNEAAGDLLESAFALPYEGRYAAIGLWDYRPGDAILDTPPRYTVRNYVPLYDGQNRVAAVVKIDKAPEQLQHIIRRGQILVWACVLGAGLLTYLALFWLARHAAHVMRDQQRRLVESEKLTVIGEMSLAVAHGIRNPLAAIRSSAELALDDAPPAPRKHLADIITQSDRLSSWLKELLMYSRPRPGEVRPVDVVAVLGECVDSYAPRLRQAGVELEWIRPESAIPPIAADRMLLLQAFNGIVSNALEAMGPGGKLTVRCALEQAKGPVVVTIADNGPGMSRERLAQAFKPFRTSKPRGLGVGLSLVKSTLERYGGHVRIKSREHEGTLVDLVIPLSR